jgi:hypothetical protein
MNAMNKLKISLLYLAFIITSATQAQDVKHYADGITPQDLKENLSILASDAMEGRATGSRGQKMAAAFIRHHFEQLGLTGPVNGSYYQPVELYGTTPGEIYVSVGGQQINNFTDILYAGSANSGGEQKTSVVFVGKGSPEELAQVDLTGKSALVLVESLMSMRTWRSTADLMRSKGATMVFLTSTQSSEEYRKIVSQLQGFMSQGSLGLKKPDPNNPNKGLFVIDKSVAEKMMGQSMDKLVKIMATDAQKMPLKKLKPGTVSYSTNVNTRVVASENVLGYLEGTDKKDELVIITSHYDHIGKSNGTSGDIINNGADDDGSGTVAVMEMATEFMRAKKEGKGPRRSILFMTVTGEEIGLLGSEYYSANPIFPLANTVVDINIDMIGRNDPEHAGKADYVYVIGADKLSSELHEINERNNATYTKLAFDYTYNDENHPTNLYKRSDHWNFAKMGIPIVFYFDGIHEDYHKVTDEVSKIDFDVLARRAQAAFYTAWEVANRSERLKVDKK